MTWSRIPVQQSVTDRLNPQTQLLRELRQRNFPPPGEQEKNTIILISGPLRSGKSKAGWRMARSLDKTFIPSLDYHPKFTGDVKTAWMCHLSVSPVPFIQAVENELALVDAGKERGPLQPGALWLFDEPTDMKSTEWYTRVAKDVVDTVIENAFLRVNPILVTPLQGKLLGTIRDLSNLWLRMRKPGKGMFFRMERRMNYNSTRREEYQKPVGICPLDDVEKKQDKEWEERYMPIKISNARENARRRRERLVKEGYIR